MKRQYAEIIVDNKNLNTDSIYLYSIPKNISPNIHRGKRVLVPFGKGNILKDGIVVNIIEDNNSGFHEDKIKEINYYIDKDDVISEKILKLIDWIRNRYLCSYGEAMNLVLPMNMFSKSNRTVEVLKEIPNTEKNQLIDYLNSNKYIALEKIVKDYSEIDVKSIIAYLQRNCYIEINNKINDKKGIIVEKYIVKNFEKVENTLGIIKKNALSQIKLIELLQEENIISYSKLKNQYKISLQTIRSLESKKLIIIESKEESRNPINHKIDDYKIVKLNYEQEETYNEIEKYIDSDRHNKFLIHGVTGSGKTEVYLQLIKKVIEKNKIAVVLVPEIALTPQTVDRFVGRFGEKVAIIHSKISHGEKKDQIKKIKNGEIDIIIGTRSALFTEIEKVGIIIIDEEHDLSYKSSNTPKYDTIEVAEKITELYGSVLVLGSATPSVKTNWKSNIGIYKKLIMKKRASGIAMPNINIVDMKDELKEGNRTPFSSILLKKMYEELEKDNQVLLFLNSRGYSKAVVCRNCGYVYKCPHCDVSLNYHSDKNKAICHYCGYAKSLDKTCPDCGSKHIRHMGIGTERIEEEIKKLFPNKKTLRIDTDTIRKKSDYRLFYDKIKSGSIDIIIGTQMITKGLDFPDVTLVGVIIADISLNIPDYKSGEITYQLITQVSGRAGRDKKIGEVIIQTYNPDHYSILGTKNYDYDFFYENEIKLRELFNYPPFTEIITFTVIGKSEKDTDLYSKEFKEKLDIFLEKEVGGEKFQSLGPMEGLIYKQNNYYRFKIVYKVEKAYIEEVNEIMKDFLQDNRKERNKYNLRIDVNPNFIF